MKIFLILTTIITGVLFYFLGYSKTSNDTADYLKKGAFTFSVGESGGNFYRTHGSPMGVDAFGLVTKGVDLTSELGISLPSLDGMPKIGVDFGLGYKNSKNTRHTAYFYGTVDYSPNWYNGYFYAGGAFGGGIDRMKGRTIFASDGNGVTSAYKTRDNPTFVYSDFRIGTVYPITKKWSLASHFQSVGRSYNLDVKADGYKASQSPGFVFDSLDALYGNMTITNVEVYIGLQYRFGE